MAGHSKWKNIQHRKGKQDAQRGKLFNRLSREIYAAVRQGGNDPDPETNARLRSAMMKARQNNMPNSNIDNAIKKAAGNTDAVNYEEITYEGYGPSGVAVMVQCLTDNRNRTAAEVRHIFAKNGGNLGETGCVGYLFSSKGLITVSLADNKMDEDTLMMAAIEAGAEDIDIDEDLAEIIVEPAEFETVSEQLQQSDLVFQTAEITRIPSTTIALGEEDAIKMLKLMEALEDCDDVQDVQANFDIDEEIMQRLQ